MAKDEKAQDTGSTESPKTKENTYDIEAAIKRIEAIVSELNKPIDETMFAELQPHKFEGNVYGLEDAINLGRRQVIDVIVPKIKAWMEEAPGTTRERALRDVLQELDQFKCDETPLIEVAENAQTVDDVTD
jgi:hypothetical protein